jgi:alanyl-tRNA synthetase
MIADHLRSIAFIISEGVAPNHDGQGYIPRRLLRKCIGALASKEYENLDFNPFLELIKQSLCDHYPSLESNYEFVQYEIDSEIKEFFPLLKEGIKKIDLMLKKVKGDVFPGEMAFELVSTFGLPREVIVSHLADRGLKFDEQSFLTHFEHHRQVSRVLKEGRFMGSEEQLENNLEDISPTVFKGYEHLEYKSQVLALIKDNHRVRKVGSGEFFFVCKQTPFYAESGGQIGDQGQALRGDLVIKVLDCQKVGKVFLHRGSLESGELAVGEHLLLEVDEKNRLAVARNHSATHLLHAALREVVGHHALQKGSHVNGKRLRFDFQNKNALKVEQIENIESLVNRWVMESWKNVTLETDYDSAVRQGALALFGENYGEQVRVVKFGRSVELCGGTHAVTTSEIGPFAIISESSVAKGVRRIEAVTGSIALKTFQERGHLLKQAAHILGSKIQDVPVKILELLKKSKKEKPKTVKSSLKGSAFLDEKKFLVEGKNFFMAKVEADSEEAKSLGDQLIDKKEYDLVCLISLGGDSVRGFAWVKKDLSSKVKAKDMLEFILKPMGARGGGRPHFAQGGGGDPKKLPQVFAQLEQVKSFLSQSILKT